MNILATRCPGFGVIFSHDSPGFYARDHTELQPKLSILLPVYNAAAYLAPCLDSLSRQTFSDYEIVAVDDGSTDASGAILRQRASHDDRIRLVGQEHCGLVAALNTGLEACRGEVVGRMDADDICHPRRFALQIAKLDAPDGPNVVSSLVTHFPRQTLGEGFRIYEQWLNSLVHDEDIQRERFIESPIPHPSATLRRQDLIDVGGYRDEGWPEDYDLWLRLAAAGRSFGKVDQVLYLWRQHETRLTRTDSRYSVERFLACKAHHLVQGPLIGVDTVILWGAGKTGRRLSKHLIRNGAPIAAIIDIDPSKLGRKLRGHPIHAPRDLPRLLSSGESTVVLAAVSSRGARQLIREELASLGLQEGQGFWCVA